MFFSTEQADSANALSESAFQGKLQELGFPAPSAKRGSIRDKVP
jgi:hypothetical protein